MVDKGPLAVSTNVSKPEKHGSGRSAVVDYLVTTSFDGGSESLVRRSFEDFQWVQKRLVKERMGIIVPILSDKKPARAKDQFFGAFIIFRQEIMDRFLQRVIHHPELVDAPCLLPFFTANPTDWSAAKDLSSDDKDVLIKENTTNDDEADFGNGLDTIHIDAHAAMHSSDPKEKKGAMRRWFSEKRTKWALQNDNLVLEETPAEAKKFSDMKTYASHLEVCVRILSEDFKEMNSANAVVAEKTETMGSAFAQLWGEHELSNTSSSSLYQSLGKVWSNASKAIKNYVSFGERYFQHPVDDLVMDIVALQDALAKRKEAVYTLTKLTREGQSINKQLDKIRMGGNLVSQQDKFYKLETELRHVDNKVAESRNHSDLVTTRLERDIERFRVEWHERMRHVLEVYHKQHVEQLQTQLNDFSSVLPALATLDSERSNLTLSSPEPEKLEINMSFGSSGAKASVAVVGAPADLPSPPPADERTAPPAAEGVAVSPDVQAISLNASFSSDDGFDSAPAMGGESTVTANTDGTEKPIVTSLE